MSARAFLPALLLLGSCRAMQPPPEPPPEAPKSLVFHMKTKERTFDGCVAGAEGCVYARFDYPVVVEAPKGAAVEAVTGIVIAFITRPIEERDGPQSIDALMDSFLLAYRQFHSKEPRSTEAWYLERKAFVLESEPKLLSLSFSERSYRGGNQRSATLRFRNLDPETGADVALSQILRPGGEEKLLALAEARFRKVRGLEEGTSLQTAGFTFDGGVFRLTNNFALGGKGLTFFYNTSEIGPAALGPTEILLTWAEIGDLLDPDYLPDELT